MPMTVPPVTHTVDIAEQQVKVASKHLPKINARRNNLGIQLHCVPKKLNHQTHGGNFVKS